MNVALVHELLTMKGGAEKVLRILADMFPDAPIYTLLYDEKKLGDWFPRHRVHPSALTAYRLPLTANRFNHHLYLSHMPTAVEAWDFSAYDLVLSSSSAFVHGIITNSAPRHLCYVHSPARYLWDRTHDVLDRAGRGLLGPLRRAYLSRTFHKLRTWDSESAARPDRLIAASKEVERRIQLYWRRESTVIHPPIDDVWLDARNPNRAREGALLDHKDFFLIVSSLAPYKRIDLAIQACNRLNVPLKIAGSGPAERSLQSIAGPTVEFVGHKNDTELRDLYVRARATLFPGDEDFGLVPLESMACGTPVIAYRSGGALETIVEDKTGMFFDEPTAESLARAITSFDRRKFNPEIMRAHAQKFSRKAFEQEIQKEIGVVMK